MSLDALLNADFKTRPWLHQIREFEEGVDEHSRALLWQMRTGKSKMMVDTACHLYLRGEIDAVIVFAPNGVHENWILREVPTHSWPSVPYRTRCWITDDVSAMRRKNASRAEREAAKRAWKQMRDDVKDDVTQPDLLWMSFNNESVTRPDVRNLVALIVKHRRVLIIWDESSDYRTPGSKRTLMMRALAERVEKANGYLRILDGTASHNSPLHLFSQFELLGKAKLGFSKYSDFEARFAEYEQTKGPGGKRYPRLSHYKNLDDLKARMAPFASVVLRSDCEDLPDIRTRVREIECSDEQNRAYAEMYTRTLSEIGDQKISIREQAARLNKLQQIVSGFIIDAERRVHDIPGGNPRLDALSEEVRLAPGKVIVWCQFQHEIDAVVRRLKSDGHKVLEYHGRVSAADKAHARVAFQEDSSIKVIVGHPQAGGRGVEFSAADTIIWYSHTFDAIIRDQAKERATKMGGANVEMIDFVAIPVHRFNVDRYILANTTNKVNVADDVAGNGLKAVLTGLTPSSEQATDDGVPLGKDE